MNTTKSLKLCIARANKAFRVGSRNKFENRLPVYVSLQRKAQKAGITLPNVTTLAQARKAIASVA